MSVEVKSVIVAVVFVVVVVAVGMDGVSVIEIVVSKGLTPHHLTSGEKARVVEGPVSRSTSV